ncbi:arsenate reductase [Uruburuella testudinis]|uniref:Arsenate reductase n=1 Tax=Uruburuella testudinis TaxID=1282863 RepID=A0ABY4DR54_9NEIS|nr:arsenate reductase [Uruburuella testudinis]UOO81195.1 arsenate reductase [Uruburuella testudinis]
MTKIYGIPNCDTVKKARQWLADNGIEYEFVDFKKTPPDEVLIKSWLADVPLETLLNKRGITWRKLDDGQKAAAEHPASAIRLMVEQPSLIKRPVLDAGGRCYAGFQTACYESVFKK